MTKFNLPRLLSHNFLTMVEDCEKNNIPWQQPYITANQPISVATGKHYRGLNILMLLMASFRANWQDPRWGTYSRWKAMGGQVRKGSSGTIATYYKMVPWKTTNPDTNKIEETQRPFMRYFTLFNAEQCDGIEPLLLDKGRAAQNIETADNYLTSAGAKVQYSHAPPYYNYKKDYINLLHKDNYKDTKHSTATESFYSAWTHELTHWTGNKERNDRVMTGDQQSDEYAFEELIAELGSIFLCQKLGIALEPRVDNAAYMASWIKRIRSDNNALIRATKLAQHAIDYIDQVSDININVPGE